MGVLTTHRPELTMHSEHTSNMHRHLRKEDNKYSNAKSSILTATYVWHKCSKRYTRDTYTVTTTHLSHHSNKACIITYKISTLSTCSQEVTTCFTSPYFVNHLPAKCFLRGPEWKTLAARSQLLEALMS